MEHTKHIWRATLLVVALLVFYSLGRQFVVPATFGGEGFYRAESRLEMMAYPVRHGGAGSCAACHQEQQDTHDGGKHAAVACEVCHAPLSQHAEGGEKTADMPTWKSKELCALCHAPLVARPKDFPQVDFEAHLVDQGAMEPGDPIPDQSCGLCHPAHDPAQED
jgi:hypothetical protein